MCCYACESETVVFLADTFIRVCLELLCVSGRNSLESDAMLLENVSYPGLERMR